MDEWRKGIKSFGAANPFKDLPHDVSEEEDVESHSLDHSAESGYLSPKSAEPYSWETDPELRHKILQIDQINQVNWYPRILAATYLFSLASLAISAVQLLMGMKALHESVRNNQDTSRASWAHLLDVFFSDFTLQFLLPAVLWGVAAAAVLKRPGSTKLNVPASGHLRRVFQCACGERFQSDMRCEDAREETLIILRALPELFSNHSDRYLRSMASTEAQRKQTESRSPASSSTTRASSTAIQPNLSSQRRREFERSLDITEMDRDQEFDSPPSGNTTPKFLIFCFPGTDGYQIEQRETEPDLSDTVLMEKVKAEYFKKRSTWAGLNPLRGFSGIRLARFELRYIPQHLFPAAIDWEWPNEENSDWEFSTSGVSSIEGDSTFMTQLWSHAGKHQKNPGSRTPERPQRNKPKVSVWLAGTNQLLPVSRTALPVAELDSPPLLSMASRIKIYLHISPRDSLISKDAEEPQDESESQLWRNASIQVEYPSDSYYIYYRTPKKLKEPLGVNSDGKTLSIGWAIWIDEDFTFHWLLLASLYLIFLGSFVFAIVYTAKTGQKANGWTIMSCVIALGMMVLTGLVLRSKDSKHARA